MIPAPTLLSAAGGRKDLLRFSPQIMANNLGVTHNAHAVFESFDLQRNGPQIDSNIIDNGILGRWRCEESEDETVVNLMRSWTSILISGTIWWSSSWSHQQISVRWQVNERIDIEHSRLLTMLSVRCAGESRDVTCTRRRYCFAFICYLFSLYS